MARPIDADAVKFSISGLRYIDPNDYFALAEYFMKQVKAMPTLTQPNEWVSVEERRPQLRENVLVCAYWHEHWGVYIGWNNGHGWTVSCGIGQRNDVQVSHWMPLPEPPDRRPPEGEVDA